MIVEGPITNVKRQVLSLRRLNLTKFVIDLPRGARTKTVKKYFESSEVVKKWLETGVAKKIAKRAIRRSLSDFDRHKVMCAQKKVWIRFWFFVLIASCL